MPWDPDHPGDRVMYDGREYRAVTVRTEPVASADLVATDDPNVCVLDVHRSHLTMSWCPKWHGGKGRPRNTGPGGDHCTTCQQETHHEDWCHTIDGKVTL